MRYAYNKKRNEKNWLITIFNVAATSGTPHDRTPIWEGLKCTIPYALTGISVDTQHVRDTVFTYRLGCTHDVVHNVTCHGDA